MPNFSKFPYLEKLTMSGHNIIGFETPRTALENLAAPKLIHVTLDFTLDYEDTVSRTGFGEDQVKWMQEFAYLRATDYAQCRLEKIDIVFHPKIDPYRIRREESMAWPWEHVEQAKQCVAQHGFILEYSAPLTKNGWDAVAQRETSEYRELRGG